MSTTGSGYIGIAESCKSLLYIGNLMGFLGVKLNEEMIFENDNLGASFIKNFFGSILKILKDKIKILLFKVTLKKEH